MLHSIRPMIGTNATIICSVYVLSMYNCRTPLVLSGKDPTDRRYHCASSRRFFLEELGLDSKRFASSTSEPDP